MRKNRWHIRLFCRCGWSKEVHSEDLFLALTGVPNCPACGAAERDRFRPKWAYPWKTATVRWVSTSTWYKYRTWHDGYYEYKKMKKKKKPNWEL